MRYLIFGGAGYLGSHLVLQLKKDGHDLVIFDNFTGHLKSTFESNVRIVEGDITSIEDISLIKAHGNFDGVFHVAAKKSVTESIRNSQLYMKVNALGTQNIIDFCTENNITNFVFTSSAAVYGEGNFSRIKESNITEPKNPYGESKLKAESFLEHACVNLKISAVTLRIFNIVGAAQPNLYDDQGENVLPVMTRALRDNSIFTIHGNSYNTSDGTCIRDYINVSDVVSAHIAAMNFLIEKPLGSYEVLNIGSGTGTSILELIKLINLNSSNKLKWSIGPMRDGDPESVISDITLAKRLLSWNSNIGIEESIRQSLLS